MKKQVSVVIPTYNLKKELLECIESIVKQDYPNLEIVVVDNGSTDGTVKSIKSLIINGLTNLRLVENARNLGVTGGRNAGIKTASGRAAYLFFFDHDMVAETDMIAQLVKVAESDPKIGIVTPKIYYFGDKKRIWAAGTGINLWTGQIIFRGGEDEGQYEEVEEVQVAPAAILVKRKVLDKIGGFDDIYFATYEDTDFCFRAKKAGFRIIYAPKAVAYHKIPVDYEFAMRRLLSRSYFVGRNRIIFMKRFGRNFWAFLLFLPIYFAYYTFLSLRFKKKGGIVNFVKGTLEGLGLVLGGEV